MAHDTGESAESALFYSDAPIKNDEDDCLGRSAIATRMANIICSVPSGASVAVGLYGSWGSGKTSVINMLEDKLRKDERVMAVVRFDPWDYVSDGQLAVQFCREISGALGLIATKKEEAPKKRFRWRSGDSTAELLDAFSAYYMALLSSGVLTPLFNGFDSGAAATLGFGAFGTLALKMLSCEMKKKSVDIAAQKATLATKLEKLDAKIVVLIDDVDRLPNDQIRLVFQLVASLAKLPNINYLVACDEEVVARALGNVQDCDGRLYMEKVIQIPVRLPKAVEDDLFASLTCRIKRSLGTFGYRDGDFDRYRWNQIWSDVLRPSVQTMRDVIRFSNALNAKLIVAPKNLVFSDAAVVTALEVYHPLFVDWIWDHKEELCGAGHLMIGLEGRSQAEERKGLEAQLASALPDEDPSFCLAMLCTLFPRIVNRTGLVQYGFDHDSEVNGVWSSESFDLYFTGNRLDGVDVHEVDDLLNEYLPKHVAATLDKHIATGDFIRFAQAILRRLSLMQEGRAGMICNEMLCQMGRCNEVHATPFVSVDADEQIIRVAKSCLEKMDEAELENTLGELLTRGFNVIPGVCRLLSWQRRSLVMPEGPSGCKRLIEGDRLEALCDKVLCMVDEEASKHNLFDDPKMYSALCFWHQIDSDSFEAYVKKAIEGEPLGFAFVLDYLVDKCNSLQTGRPGLFKFDVSQLRGESFFDLLVNRMRQAKKLSMVVTLPEAYQLVVAAFEIALESNQESAEISVGDARARVCTWMKEGRAMSQI